MTNALFLSLVASALLIIGAFLLRKKLKMAPGKIQTAIEMAVEGLINMMESVFGSRKEAEK